MGQNHKKLFSLAAKLLGIGLVFLLWACSGGALGSGEEGGALDALGHGGAQGQATPTHSEGTVDPKWDGNPGLDSKSSKTDGDEGNDGSVNDDNSNDASAPHNPSPPGGRPPFDLSTPGSDQNNKGSPAMIKRPGKT